jgi:hypothetical protein
VLRVRLLHEKSEVEAARSCADYRNAQIASEKRLSALGCRRSAKSEKAYLKSVFIFDESAYVPDSLRSKWWSFMMAEKLRIHGWLSRMATH